MLQVARSPRYDVNATAPIADNDIDLKVCSGKKFNAATDCDDFAAVSTFGESRRLASRTRASDNRRANVSEGGGPRASFSTENR